MAETKSQNKPTEPVEELTPKENAVLPLILDAVNNLRAEVKELSTKVDGVQVPEGFEVVRLASSNATEYMQITAAKLRELKEQGKKFSSIQEQIVEDRPTPGATPASEAQKLRFWTMTIVYK